MLRVFQLNSSILDQEIEYIKMYYNVFIIHIYYSYNIQSTYTYNLYHFIYINIICISYVMYSMLYKYIYVCNIIF